MSYDYYNTEANPYGSTLIDVDLGDVEAWGSGNDRFLLPAGSYPVIIAKAELKTAGTGSRFINLQYTVTDGQYARRSIFDRFYLWSPKAQQVAKARFKALRRAVGLNENVGGTLEELVQREFLCTVKTKESTRPNAEPGERENEVSSYKPLPRQAAPATQAPQRPAAPAASAAPVAAPAASASSAPRQQSLVQPSEQAAQTAQAANGAYPW